MIVKLPKRNCYKLTKGKKSRPKYIGPLPIMMRIGRVAYRAEFPSSCKLPNVLHVGVIKSYFVDKEDTSKNKLKWPMFELKKAEKKVAKAILDDRIT